MLETLPKPRYCTNDHFCAYVNNKLQAQAINIEVLHPDNFKVHPTPLTGDPSRVVDINNTEHQEAYRKLIEEHVLYLAAGHAESQIGLHGRIMGMFVRDSTVPSP